MQVLHVYTKCWCSACNLHCQAARLKGGSGGHGRALWRVWGRRQRSNTARKAGTACSPNRLGKGNGGRNTRPIPPQSCDSTMWAVPRDRHLSSLAKATAVSDGASTATGIECSRCTAPRTWPWAARHSCSDNLAIAPPGWVAHCHKGGHAHACGLWLVCREQAGSRCCAAPEQPAAHTPEPGGRRDHRRRDRRVGHRHCVAPPRCGRGGVRERQSL